MENRDTWSKVHITASVISSIIIPILLVIFGSIITEQQHKAQMSTEARADFNKNIINELINLHRKMESHLLKTQDQNKKKDFNLKKSRDFYREVTLDLSSLMLRLNASRYHNIASKQISILSDTINKLEILELSGGVALNVNIIKSIRAMVNTSFAAIIRLEQEKLYSGSNR